MIKKSEKQINGRDVYCVSDQIITADTARPGETKCEFFLTDCLEKVFPAKRPRQMKHAQILVVPGEVPALQLVYRYQAGRQYRAFRPGFTIEIDGAPVTARLRSVECVASDYPANELADDDYITKEPGVFPDLLLPLKDGHIYPLVNQYRAVWIDFPGISHEMAGNYSVQIKIRTDDTIDAAGFLIETSADAREDTGFALEMKVLPTMLREQTTLHTEWLHIDSLCDFYNVEPFCEAHWRQIEAFIEMAVREHAVNMLLTPVFTLPLNTGVGLERTTTQLVDIWSEENEYRFDFGKLERWCKICKKYDVHYLEISHLFTQWGAHATPKIVANTPQGEKRIFGWDVAATDSSYQHFLNAFLPELCKKLLACGYDKEHVRFHLSDEPMAALGHLESYRAARRMVEDILDGYIIMDAMSDYSLYEAGVSDHPIPGSDHFQEFFEKGFEDPWVYYCTSQDREVPNRFMAQPSYRNRIMGTLIYFYGIRGFLHWGYNYYSDMYSTCKQNPFWQTSSGRNFPSGDAYLVYPGEDGKPLSSIRAEVVRQSFDDVRLLQLLEAQSGRQAVLELIKKYFGDLSFFQYPREAEKLLDFHEYVCAEIVKTL